MTDQQQTAIAIVGMAGRFPDAPDLQTFWSNLAAGVESLASFSDEELLSSGVDANLLSNPNYVKKGTFLEGADLFDAGFFGFNPREAEVIDPQHRIFLECAWEALEDSGYASEAAPPSIGVYAGASMNTYLFSHLLPNRALLETVGSYQLMLASDKDFLATRVAYKLNLKGPCLTIQTACSTSLVAVQVACLSLLGRQCDLALAGGVSLSFPAKTGYLYTEGMILSPDGHCRPFDAKARGTRGGAGVGIVVLKRLADALRDGDTIRAVIRGAAVNNDGSLKMGYTAPSEEGQAAAIQAAQAMAGVAPESISYIEAHGTATPLGDPIEIAALERVFRARTAKQQFCAIGSLKSNIGHLDAAAGIAGLIKTVLALEHEAIPPSLHFQEPNPQIDFAASPFFVNDRLREWKRENAPRRAGVSSFGIGGTNAHVILEEAPAAAASVRVRSEQVLVLSARSERALEEATARLVRHLEDHPQLDLADACFTLQVGRKRFAHRRALVCRGREDALALLGEPRSREVWTACRDAAGRPVTFLFSGQGSQHPGMAAGLYRTEAVFRQNLDRCAELLVPEIGCDLRELLYGEDASADRLNETRFAQPALFAVEYALARMWMAWGIRPDAMLGHSIGEYVAACLAGVFSLEDALAIVAARGRLMQQLPSGGMLAAPLAPGEAAALLNGQLSLAAVNAPSLCTFSGPERAIAELERKLEARGITARRIHTSHAFHSAMMDPVLEAFTERLAQLRFSEPRIAYLSNFTGDWIRPEEATSPEYWARHLRHTVQFSQGLEHLLEEPGRLLLEVGPGQTLSTFARLRLQAQQSGETRSAGAAAEVFSSLPHPRDPRSDTTHALETLARLWISGADVDWEGFHQEERLRRVPLATYPFERQRYAPDLQPAGQQKAPEVISEARKPNIADWFYVPSWRRSVRPSQVAASGAEGPWLIFLDEASLGVAVQKILAARGEHVMTVRAGERFERAGDGSYVLDPACREDYDRLLGALASADVLPRSILHLWNVTGQAEGAAFYSLLYLAQAWGDLAEERPLDLIVASTGVHAVLSDDRIEPEKALVLGPVRVIPQEFPPIRCRHLDLDRVPDDPRGLAQDVLCEFGLARSEPIVAYRGGRCWEQVFVPQRLQPVEAASLPLRPRGVYLITGGTGGIGMVLARYLAESLQAKLVLTGRNGLPPRNDWDACLADPATPERVRRRIRQARELEQLGSEVLVLAAEASDEARMREVFAETRRTFGAVHGVIHAAGIASAGLIQLKTAATAEAVLAPKVRGTRVLEKLLREQEPPDFLALCSSINAICGGVGAVDYCAANAFLDAFAADAGRGWPVISINWDAWQEVGMAVETAVPLDMQEARRRSLELAIRPAEGVDAFRRILASSLEQVAVVTRDLPAILRERPKPAPRESSGVVKVTSPLESGQERPKLSSAYVPPESDCQQKMIGIWKQMLGVATIGLDDNFFELGGHSLLATGLLSRVREMFQVSLPLRTIFEAPTVRQLAERIETLVWASTAHATTPALASEEREEIEL